jgi:O-antigen/teichoic acid export membrane protein
VSNAGSHPDSFGVDRQNARQSNQRTGSLLSLVLATWHRNGDLIHNASSLLAATVVTTGLGFLYWAVGARLFSQRSVGYGSASISAMALLGTIGMFGLGTVLIGELPRRKDAAAGLVSAALIASSIGSLVLGVGFALIAPHVNSNLAGISGSPGRVALFAAGVVLTAFTLLADQATLGVLRSGIQLARNTAFAIVKLLLLPLAAFSLHGPVGTGIAFSWVAGMAISLVPVVIQLRLSGTAILPRPDWRLLQGLGKTALAHSWLSMAINIPIMLMPVLVTAEVSASANAAYYVAWMLAYFLYLIPTSLSNVLFAIAAADPAVIAGKLRFSLRLSFAIGIIGIAVLGLGSHLALSIFGPGYARTATLPLILLLIGYIPIVPRTHYIAVCRARGRVSQAAVVLSIGGVIEITGAVVGAKLDGLVGLSAGLLLARLVEGAMTAPSVVRASFVRDHRREVLPGNERDAATPKESKESGIAAPISLAGATKASQVPNAVVQDTVPEKIDLDKGEDVGSGKRKELPSGGSG